MAVGEPGARGVADGAKVATGTAIAVATGFGVTVGAGLAVGGTNVGRAVGEVASVGLARGPTVLVAGAVIATAGVDDGIDGIDATTAKLAGAPGNCVGVFIGTEVAGGTVATDVGLARAGGAVAGEVGFAGEAVASSRATAVGAPA